MTKEEGKEMKRHMEILYEKFQSDLKLVIEKVESSETSLRNEMGEFRSEVKRDMKLLMCAVKDNRDEILVNRLVIEKHEKILVNA